MNSYTGNSYTGDAASLYLDSPKISSTQYLYATVVIIESKRSLSTDFHLTWLQARHSVTLDKYECPRSTCIFKFCHHQVGLAWPAATTCHLCGGSVVLQTGASGAHGTWRDVIPGVYLYTTTTARILTAATLVAGFRIPVSCSYGRWWVNAENSSVRFLYMWQVINKNRVLLCTKFSFKRRQIICWPGDTVNQSDCQRIFFEELIYIMQSLKEWWYPSCHSVCWCRVVTDSARELHRVPPHSCYSVIHCEVI